MSLTQRSSESLVKMSAHLRVSPLIAQAHAALGRVADDQQVAEQLGQPFIDGMKAAVDTLETMASARQMSSALSKMAKAHQERTLVSAKEWHRAFVKLASRAVLRGLEVPHEVIECRCDRSPSTVAADIDRLIDLGTKFQQALSPLGVTPEFLRKGQDRVDALRNADARQELLHRDARANAVRMMREQAALVLILVKEVNAAAHAVYASDRAKRKPYTLEILRRGAPPKGDSPPAETPAPPAETPPTSAVA